MNMDNMLAYHLCELAASQARVEAMKAENEHYRAINGSGVKYGEDAFFHEANYMQILAQACRT